MSLPLTQQLRQVKQILERSESPSPELDAQVLLCFALNKPRSFLYTWPEYALTEQELLRLNALVQRRCNGEPIAYITGEREFWSLSLKVSMATLIPRPETERLVEIALDKVFGADGQAPLMGDLLDLGTGTGAIALALASELPSRQIYALDRVPDAIELAKRNGAELGLNNVHFLLSHWFDNLSRDQRFDLIVSNPPYIDENDEHLTQGDVRFEPLSALVADNNGLSDIIDIIDKGRCFLHSNGWLMIEHGYQQASAVREIFASYGYQNVSTAQDHQGLDRVTMGQNPLE